MKNENKNGIVTLQIKLTRVEHNKASKVKGTQQTWPVFIMNYVDYLLKKNRGRK